jgi:hypothetical protein
MPTSGWRPIPFRKAYIKSVVDRIEVDDHAITPDIFARSDSR